MGHMKNLLITIYGGGGEAVEAAKKLSPSWIPVSERLPEGDARVLVLVDGVADIACLNWQYGWMYEDYGSLEPTHWMNLPSAPEVTP